MKAAADSGDDILLNWLTGAALRVLLVCPPLEVIGPYDYNNGTTKLRSKTIQQEVSNYWTATVDIIWGFTQATLGNSSLTSS